MRTEIAACVEYIMSLIDQTITSQTSKGKVGTELSNALIERYSGHWNPQCPTEGSAYRCIMFSPTMTDSSLVLALDKAGIHPKILDSCVAIRRELRIWVDPGDVSFKYDNGIIQQYYGRTQPSTSSLDSDVASSPDVSPKLSAKAATFTPRPSPVPLIKQFNQAPFTQPNLLLQRYQQQHHNNNSNNNNNNQQQQQQRRRRLVKTQQSRRQRGRKQQKLNDRCSVTTMLTHSTTYRSPILTLPIAAV